MSSKPPIHVGLQLQLAGLSSYQIHSVDYVGGISEPFLINLELTTSEGVMFFDQALFTPMTLTILGDTTPAYCTGILYNATLLYSLQDGRGYYRLELRPSLALLESVVRSGVFNDLSIVELTQGILLDRDVLASPVLSSKEQLRFALSKPDEAYPRLAQWLQANESVLAFWQRCLSQQGLSFAFDHRSEHCPLVISDQLERVFEPFPVPASGFDLDELSLAPRLSRVRVTKSSQGPQRIRVTGYNPDFPDQTIDAVSLVNPKSSSQVEYLWRFDALSQDEAETWSEWVAEYHRGKQHASRAEARGMLFAGERMAIADHPVARDSLIAQSHLRLLVDAHRSNQLRQSVAEFVFHAEQDNAPYREPPRFHRENGIMVGAKVLSLAGAPTGDDHALDGKGNYTVAFPEAWHTVGRGYMSGLRAVQPIHTQDHQLNMPMPVGSEVTLAFHADSLLRPFIAGATTHSNKPSLTQNTNPQDSVLQDKRGNRLAFINQGEFDREHKTGRKAATVLETPNYNPQGQSSYVRSGDPVDSDLAYPSVYGSAGLFAYTEGDLHAQHDGGQVTLIGNRGDGDLSAPGQPVYRHLVQADLKDGGMHVMESSTVDHHQQRVVVKDAHITTTHDADSITTKHVAKQTVEQVNANTVSQHYVNREDHYQSGMVSSGYHQYQHTLNTPLHQTTQSGTLRQDDHFGLRTTHMLHAENTHTANSLTQNIDEGQYQINTHEQVSNSLNEQIGSLNRSEGQTVYQAGNYQDVAQHYAHTGQMSIMSDAAPSVKGPQLKVGHRAPPKPRMPAEIVISIIDTQGADISTSALAPVMRELKARYQSTQTGENSSPETQADLSAGKFSISVHLSQVSQIELQLLPGPLSRQQSVSIVALNGQSLPMVSDTVTLDLAGLPYKTQPSTRKRTYTITLMILPPALMFNFRQDFAQSAGNLHGNDLTTYQTLLPYFQNTVPYTDPNNPILQPWMLNYFKAQGNNVTLFIHGYNVHYGQFIIDQTTRAQSGTGAHHWLLNMELNLNQAAGFNPAAQRKNYTHYTRLLGIAWMGDPTETTDYMAATATTHYPAQQTAALIKQLKGEGLTVNILAHSLGNEVLLNTLDLCAEQGTPVDHVFMWEAAVPNDALNPEPRNYFPMTLKGQRLHYGYNYPAALKAAEKWTILYSDDDSILANLPAHNTDLSDIKVVWDTYEDPAGGSAMAGIAAGTSLINSDLPGQLKGKVISIYHLANLYVYPFSFFFNASDADLEAYYASWRAHYQTYLNPKGQPIPLAQNLSQQQFQIRNRYPRLFGIIEGGFGGKTLSPEAIAQGIASYQVGQAEADTDWLPKAVEHITLKVFQHFQDALAAVDNTRPATFATILITGLLTPEAAPRAALGTVGISQHNPVTSALLNHKIFQTPQQDPHGKDLCIDHSAMKFPTPAFMKYVYVETLMHPRKESGESFQIFGTWPNIGKSNETERK